MMVIIEMQRQNEEDMKMRKRHSRKFQNRYETAKYHTVNANCSLHQLTLP